MKSLIIQRWQQLGFYPDFTSQEPDSLKKLHKGIRDAAEKALIVPGGEISEFATLDIGGSATRKLGILLATFPAGILPHNFELRLLQICTSWHARIVSDTMLGYLDKPFGSKSLEILSQLEAILIIEAIISILFSRKGAGESTIPIGLLHASILQLSCYGIPETRESLSIDNVFLWLRQELTNYIVGTIIPRTTLYKNPIDELQLDEESIRINARRLLIALEEYEKKTNLQLLRPLSDFAGVERLFHQVVFGSV